MRTKILIKKLNALLKVSSEKWDYFIDAYFIEELIQELKKKKDITKKELTKLNEDWGWYLELYEKECK